MLWLRTDHYGNGYNYDILLGDHIMNLYENYVIINTFSGATSYNQARQIFDNRFIVEDKYVEITKGMIEGIEAAGVSLFSPTVNDYIIYKGVLIANSIPDFSAFADSWNNKGPGCSDMAKVWWSYTK